MATVLNEKCEFPLINQHETLQVGMSYQDTIKEFFWAQLDCKVLANLRKLQVLKCIIMHSLWQLAEARSRSLSSVSIIHVLQVHSWSRQEVWSAILDATEFQKLQKYCRKYCRNARFIENATSPLVLIRSF